MPSKKRLSGQELKAFRSDISKLKSKGLVAKRVDARKVKPTRHMLEKRSKFEDVLKGTAKTVKARNSRQARGLDELFGKGHVGSTVVVPTGKTGRATIIKGKRGADDKVYVNRTENGKKTRSEFVSGISDNLRGLPSGKNIRYRMTFGNGQTFTFDNLKDLAEFMYPYEHAPKNAFKNWRKYIEVIKVEDEDADE